MTTDQQVRLLMSLIKKGVPLSTAAAKAGMSEPTARKYRQRGKVPSEMRVAHTWRTWTTMQNRPISSGAKWRLAHEPSWHCFQG